MRREGTGSRAGGSEPEEAHSPGPSHPAAHTGGGGASAEKAGSPQTRDFPEAGASEQKGRTRSRTEWQERNSAGRKATSQSLGPGTAAHSVPSVAPAYRVGPEGSVLSLVLPTTSLASPPSGLLPSAPTSSGVCALSRGCPTLALNGPCHNTPRLCLPGPPLSPPVCGPGCPLPACGDCLSYNLFCALFTIRMGLTDGRAAGRCSGKRFDPLSALWTPPHRLHEGSSLGQAVREPSETSPLGAEE